VSYDAANRKSPTSNAHVDRFYADFLELTLVAWRRRHGCQSQASVNDGQPQLTVDPDISIRCSAIQSTDHGRQRKSVRGRTSQNVVRQNLVVRRKWLAIRRPRRNRNQLAGDNERRRTQTDSLTRWQLVVCNVSANEAARSEVTAVASTRAPAMPASRNHARAQLQSIRLHGPPGAAWVGYSAA